MKRTGFFKQSIKALGIVGVGILPFIATAAIPSNDDIEFATLLTGTEIVAQGSSVDASRQTFENGLRITDGANSTASGGRSVWWKWRAPSAGNVVVATGGSGGQSSFDTQLAVFSGPDPVVVSSLTTIGSNEDNGNVGGVGLSLVEFTATQNQTYYIMVDGYESATGAIRLHLTLTSGTNTNGGGGTTNTNTNVVVTAGTFWWQNQVTGQIGFWNVASNFASVVSFGVISNLAYPAWQVFAVEDWDNNGSQDFFVQNGAGQVGLWLMNGLQFQQGVWISSNSIVGWRVVAFTDMNEDGTKDLVWQRTGSPIGIWTLSKSNIVSVGQPQLLQTPAAPPGWDIVSAGNFSGSGRQDLLWLSQSGQLAVWAEAGDGTYPLSGARLMETPTVGTYWKVAAARDFNNDGSLDLMWTGAGGEQALWPMNNLTLRTNEARLLQTPSALGWRLITP